MNKHPKILIVDDEAVNISVMVEMLPEEFELSVVKSALKALDITQKLLPDIVILDVYMPGMDGLEVAKAIRNNPDTSHIPIIFCTTDDSQALSKELKDISRSIFLFKPFSKTKLLETVESFLN